MITWKPHSKKQNDFLFSEKKIAILATGIQYGKTASGVVWLKMMMHKYTDPTDNFIVASPTYKILAQSTLPPFMDIMGDCGVLDKQNYVFRMHGGGSCWFRTGQNPDSPVGITNVRAILCDEAGLYSRYFWDNLQARSSFKSAPIRIVTSPYSLNWLYHDFIRKHQKKDEFILSICDMYQATSKENPYFPDDEYEQRRRTMDARRFNMIYGGNFDKADGLVYDIFDIEAHVVPMPEFPPGTEFVGGIDWGFTDPFVCKIRAINPDGVHYDVAEYYKTNLTLREMIEAVRKMQISLGFEARIFHADPSRPDYINEFCRAGIKTIAADNDIRLGIDRHYELIKSGKYYVVEGTCPHSVDEYELYHYPELKDLKPDQSQKDELPVGKDDHCMDVTRYITSATYKPQGRRKNRVTTHSMEQKTFHSKDPFYDTEVHKLMKKKKRNANNYI